MSRVVEELSLMGLFARLDEIDRLKDRAKREEGDEAIIASDGAVKKAIASMLDDADAGLLPDEKTKSKLFLEAQMKSLDPNAKNASVRKEKLAALLQKIDKAPGRDVPEHVKKAKDALKKVKQASKEINETYQKWERGKLMFKTNDELKAMKQKHEDMQKCLEATELYVEEMGLLRRDNGPGPPRLPADNPSAPRPKAKSSTVSRDPAVHTSGAMPRSSGYPMKTNTNINAFRQAELVAEIRTSVEAEIEAPRSAPKPSRAPKPVEDEPQVVLSYSCTCKAVAELRGITVNQAAELAESSNDFRAHFNESDWETVKTRSLALEKEQKAQQREKEQRKSEKAVGRITDKHGPAYSTAPVAKSMPNRTAPSAAATKAAVAPKAKTAPKTGAPPKASIKGLAQVNRFGGLDSDDDDDDDGGGWSTVKR